MSQANSAARAAAISFRQLRLFAAIGDLQSVRRASEECSLSQPAVTQALAKLEEQLGVMLVDRRASGSYLNEFGAIFHARIKRFFDQAEQAIVEAGAADGHAAARVIMNRFTRSQIRTVVGAIEHGSFERASGSAGVSSASLQRAARDLESNLRVSLFYRTAAGMLVSPIGIDFGRRMKLALQEIEWGIEDLEAARGGSSRQMVIGAMPFGGSVLLASVLDDFLGHHPHADIRIMNESASEMAKSLRAGDVDFVIGLLPELNSNEVIREPLARTPYSIVARRGHPLTRQGKVSIDDLLQHDWVIGTAGSSRRACFEGIFADGPSPQAPIATCALPVIRHLLKRSDRLTLMTSYELEHEDDALRAVMFGPIAPVPSLGITMRADWLPTRLHKAFIDIIRSHVSAPRPSLREAG
jgi:LysR family transcriptional regulator of gallate degradation